jgi:hypothetical protein
MKRLLKIPELRRWSAESLLGYEPILSPDCEKYRYPFYRDKEGREFSWAPTLNSSPAWQIKAVIEAMEKKGLYLTMHSFPDSEGRLAYQAEFRLPDENCKFNIADYDFQTAILDAAHSAWKAGKGESG